MRTKAESRALRFDRELNELLLNSGLDEVRAKKVRNDPLLDELSWPERWTWLGVLSLAIGHEHGLTFASRQGMCRARVQFQQRGSSEAAVKRHIQVLQRMGLLLRFMEMREGEERKIKHVYVTVVILPDPSGFRRGRSPQAQELVHGWGSGKWVSDGRVYFLGPRLKTSKTDRPFRRPIYFEDLVALDADAAANAAVSQGPPPSAGHSACGATHLKKKKAPDNQTQNRASAEVSQAPEPTGDGPDGGELADPGQDAKATRLPLQGPPEHRRPQGGIPEHPRPEGGIRGSLTGSAMRVS